MRVAAVSYELVEKVYRLENKKILRTHRYCPLGIGDDIVVVNANKAHVRCDNGIAQILPIYTSKDTLSIGKRTLRFTVKEIETEEELAAYHQLEEYHYRGKMLHGRRVPLIIRCEDPLLPFVLGYIELATAFLMNRPRTLILDDEFQDETGKIKWKKWTKEAVSDYTNLVVRIARTVISPEFRGLGLAGTLVKHAIRYSRKHWHVGQLKPLFIEITADMLRYVPFVESSGMHYIGETEGNLARVNVDMNYILKNFNRIKKKEILKRNSGGIVDLQVSYATFMKNIEKTNDISREDLLRLLLRSPHQLSDDNWALLHRIFRLPKPTFLMGLTRVSEYFVINRIRKLNLPTQYPVKQLQKRKVTLTSPIEIKKCTLKLSSPLIRTRATRRIQQAFGVNRDMLNTTLFADLSFSINHGDMVLICGPSGAGKTTLLSLLKKCLLNPKDKLGELSGTIKVPQTATVTTLGPLSNSRPLVDSLSGASFESALYSLNVSGLAEAHLYIKRFRELSNGQQYRAMIAKLIASQTDIWMADEFCATLDPITANIVSRNLRRCAKELGITTILAAANWSEFIDELRPDAIVHLRAPWDYRVFSWREFKTAIRRSNALGIR